MTTPQPLVIVGASARAAAQSAVRAGYAPWCVDRFADRDLQRIATAHRCPPDTYPLGILPLLERAPHAPVLLTGAMENHLEVLSAIETRRPLWGSSVKAMSAVRGPNLFKFPPAITGIDWPEVAIPSWWLNPTRGRRFIPRGGAPVDYIIKPIRSGGGAGVRRWSPRGPVGRDHVLQTYIEGMPIGVAYRADDDSIRLLGVTQQIIGDARFGSRHAFQYCGSIGPIEPPQRDVAALTELGEVLAERYGLRGLFGVDAIVSQLRPPRIHPVEVNPRYTASVEVLERATRRAALAPADDWPAGAIDGMIHGKAILYAQNPGKVPDLYELFAESQVGDVPAVGDDVAAGEPICTLFASGQDQADCLNRLHTMAQRLYTRLSI